MLRLDNDGEMQRIKAVQWIYAVQWINADAQLFEHGNSTEFYFGTIKLKPLCHDISGDCY